MIIQTGMRTDIPAFYSEWLMNRIQEGFVLVRNPYNPTQVTKYSLSPEVVDLIAFCTKNPAPMLPFMEQLTPYGQYWFVTITPYGRDIEPNVPDTGTVMDHFKILSDIVGVDSIGWRYDPILVDATHTVEWHISEFEKMKAGKYSEALDDLLENGKITYFELYKCQNFLKIAKIADEYHQEKQEEESKFFDFDWFMRFFDTAGNVSSEKMQRLWAKILSNEIENVGSFSLRAIETLKNMNQHEASLFQQMAHFVLTDSSGIKFLLSTDNDLGVNVNEKYGLTKADIITLEECGILNSLRNDNRISLDSKPCGIWSENILLILKLKNSDGGLFSYKYSGYSLTKAACQLLSIVDSEPNDEYLLDVGREFARKYSGNFIVKAHKVLDSSVDTFKYDSDLDLLL